MNDDDLYKYYTNNIEIVNNNNDSTCKCIDNNIVLDDCRYYNVCNKCGLCISVSNETVISYESMKSLMYTPKRCYTKISYLRIKLNNLLRSKKPVLDNKYMFRIRKKIKKVNINNVVKYMKKNKLMMYDPLKTFYAIKKKDFIVLTNCQFERLLCDFKIKEKVYRDNKIKRFNYNFVLLKIFEEWKNTELIECIKLLQDDNILIRHQTIYDRIFN